MYLICERLYLRNLVSTLPNCVSMCARFAFLDLRAKMTTASTSSARKDAAVSAMPSSNASAGQRLQRELKSLMLSPNTMVSAFPDGDNYLSMIGTIHGAPGTVYEGFKYKLSLKFPQNYPFGPPTVKFDPPCFHPNVDQYGNICLDILKDQWSAAYNLQTVLISIQSLLGEPNNASPLNPHAAQLWSDQAAYRELVLKRNAESFGN